MLHHRHRGGVDVNHAAIADALRKAGLFVLDTSALPDGCPDLFVFRPGHETFIYVEVKRPGPPSARNLSPDEAAWHAKALGLGVPVMVAQSAQEVIERLFLRR